MDDVLLPILTYGDSEDDAATPAAVGQLQTKEGLGDSIESLDMHLNPALGNPEDNAVAGCESAKLASSHDAESNAEAKASIHANQIKHNEAAVAMARGSVPPTADVDAGPITTKAATKDGPAVTDSDPSNQEELPLEADFETRRRRAVFTAMLILLEHGARDPDHLSHLVAPMSGDELQQVAEERALAGLCGNPLCGSAHVVTTPPSRRHWDPVGGFTEPPPPSHFCSAACELLIESYAAQLGADPLERLKPEVRQLLAASHAPRRPGMENVAAQGGGVATMLTDVQERDPGAAEALALAGGRELDRRAAEGDGGCSDAVEGYVPGSGKRGAAAAATASGSSAGRGPASGGAAAVAGPGAPVVRGEQRQRRQSGVSGVAAAGGLKSSLRKKPSSVVGSGEGVNGEGEASGGGGGDNPPAKGYKERKRRVTFGPKVEHRLPPTSEAPEPKSIFASSRPAAPSTSSSVPMSPSTSTPTTSTVTPTSTTTTASSTTANSDENFYKTMANIEKNLAIQLDNMVANTTFQSAATPTTPTPSNAAASVPSAVAAAPAPVPPLQQPVLLFDVEEDEAPGAQAEGQQDGSGGVGLRVGPDWGRLHPQRGPGVGPRGTLRVVEAEEVLSVAAAAEGAEAEEGGQPGITDAELAGAMAERITPRAAPPRAMRLWFPPAAGGVGVGSKRTSKPKRRQQTAASDITHHQQQQQGAVAPPTSHQSVDTSAPVPARYDESPSADAAAPAPVPSNTSPLAAASTTTHATISASFTSSGMLSAPASSSSSDTGGASGQAARSTTPPGDLTATNSTASPSPTSTEPASRYTPASNDTIQPAFSAPAASTGPPPTSNAPTTSTSTNAAALASNAASTGPPTTSANRPTGLRRFMPSAPPRRKVVFEDGPPTAAEGPATSGTAAAVAVKQRTVLPAPGAPPQSQPQPQQQVQVTTAVGTLAAAQGREGGASSLTGASDADAFFGEGKQAVGCSLAAITSADAIVSCAAMEGCPAATAATTISATATENTTSAAGGAEAAGSAVADGALNACTTAKEVAGGLSSRLAPHATQSGLQLGAGVHGNADVDVRPTTGGSESGSGSQQLSSSAADSATSTTTTTTSTTTSTYNHLSSSGGKGNDDADGTVSSSVIGSGSAGPGPPPGTSIRNTATSNTTDGQTAGSPCGEMVAAASDHSDQPTTATDHWAPWAPAQPTGPPKVHVVHVRSDKRPAGGGVPIPPEAQPYFPEEEEDEDEEDLHDERLVYDDRDADEMADDLYAGSLRGVDQEEEEEEEEGPRDVAEREEREEGVGRRPPSQGLASSTSAAAAGAAASARSRLGTSQSGKTQSSGGKCGRGGGDGGAVEGGGASWWRQQRHQHQQQQPDPRRIAVGATPAPAAAPTPAPDVTPPDVGAVTSSAAVLTDGDVAPPVPAVTNPFDRALSTTTASNNTSSSSCDPPAAPHSAEPVPGEAPATISIPATACHHHDAASAVSSRTWAEAASDRDAKGNRGGPTQRRLAVGGGGAQRDGCKTCADPALNEEVEESGCGGSSGHDGSEGDAGVRDVPLAAPGFEPWMLRDDLDSDLGSSCEDGDDAASNASSADDYNYKSMLPYFHRTTQHYHLVLSPYNQVQTALVGWITSRTVAFVVGVGLGPLREPGPAMADDAYTEEGADGIPDPSACQARGVLLQLLRGPVREACGALGVRVAQSDIDRKLTTLVATFRLSGPIPSFKPAQWHLLALALLQALSRHHIPALRSNMLAPATAPGRAAAPPTGPAHTAKHHHASVGDVEEEADSQAPPPLRAGGGMTVHGSSSKGGGGGGPSPALLTFLERTGFDVHYLTALVDLLVSPEF